MESTVFCRGEDEQVVVKGAINKGNVIYIYKLLWENVRGL